MGWLGTILGWIGKNPKTAAAIGVGAGGLVAGGVGLVHKLQGDKINKEAQAIRDKAIARYPDRLVFTERGEKEASRCELNPDHLWKVLFTVANDLTEVYRSAKGPLTDEQIMCATGFDVSLHEGSMTREQSEFMRLREDEIDGKKISVEPHLKLKQAKGEPAHQRLHFQYDPEMRRIVVGYVGDHLDSAATKFVKKR